MFWMSTSWDQTEGTKKPEAKALDIEAMLSAELHSTGSGRCL